MFDDRSVFTTNILVAEGMYYLVYQAVSTLRTPSLWLGQINYPWTLGETGRSSSAHRYGGVWKGSEGDASIHWTKVVEEEDKWDRMKVTRTTDTTAVRQVLTRGNRSVAICMTQVGAIADHLEGPSPNIS